MHLYALSPLHLCPPTPPLSTPPPTFNPHLHSLTLSPSQPSSRLHNKGFYLQLGLQKMVHKTETRELRRHVALTVDRKRIDLPDIAGLIVLNIQSWGAGADPWGTTNDPVCYVDLPSFLLSSLPYVPLPSSSLLHSSPPSN